MKCKRARLWRIVDIFIDNCQISNRKLSFQISRQNISILLKRADSGPGFRADTTTHPRSMAEDAGAGTALSFEEHYERIEKKPLGEGTYGEVGAAAR